MKDISSEVANLIASAEVFGSSDNIRHGKYKFIIRRIFAEEVAIKTGAKHKMAFMEVTPYESLPNPQIEGDRVNNADPSSPLIDNGMNPNPVGSVCAVKVDFDGPGAKPQASTLKQAIHALLGKREGELSQEDFSATWEDLARQKDVQAGDVIGFDLKTKQPIVAKKAKKANPACGMVLSCHTAARKKKTPNEKGAYITKLIFECISPPGVGENAPELVAKRKSEIERSAVVEEEEEEMPVAAASIPIPANGAPVTPMPTPSAPLPPPPPPPAPAVFVPPAPWVEHPTSKGWYWSDPSKGGNNQVVSEAQLRQ